MSSKSNIASKSCTFLMYHQNFKNCKFCIWNRKLLLQFLQASSFFSCHTVQQLHIGTVLYKAFICYVILCPSQLSRNFFRVFHIPLLCSKKFKLHCTRQIWVQCKNNYFGSLRHFQTYNTYCQFEYTSTT